MAQSKKTAGKSSEGKPTVCETEGISRSYFINPKLDFGFSNKTTRVAVT